MPTAYCNAQIWFHMLNLAGQLVTRGASVITALGGTGDPVNLSALLEPSDVGGQLLLYAANVPYEEFTTGTPTAGTWSWISIPSP